MKKTAIIGLVLLAAVAHHASAIAQPTMAANDRRSFESVIASTQRLIAGTNMVIASLSRQLAEAPPPDRAALEARIKHERGILQMQEKSLADLQMKLREISK